MFPVKKPHQCYVISNHLHLAARLPAWPLGLSRLELRQPIKAVQTNCRHVPPEGIQSTLMPLLWEVIVSLCDFIRCSWPNQKGPLERDWASPGAEWIKKRDYNEIELTVTRIAFFSPIILLAALWMSRIEGEARNIKKCVSSVRSAPAICHQRTLIIRQQIKEGCSQEIPLLKACRSVMPPCGSTCMAKRACLM